MGLLDKAGDIVGGATDAVAGAMGGNLPGIDLGKLREVVELVWSNRDAFLDLVVRLPHVLGDAGESLHLAGVGAEQASVLLTGDILALTNQAADTLDALGGPLGQVATLGRFKGIAEIPGLRLRGFPGWFVARTYHLYQLPLLSRKLRVVLDWTVALFFRRDVVELSMLGHPPRLGE